MLLTREQVKENLINKKGLSEEMAEKMVNSREYLLKVWDAAFENLKVLSGMLPENDPMLLQKKQAVRKLYHEQKTYLVEVKFDNDVEADYVWCEMNSFIREWLKVFKLPR
jgi:hypothetical protein